MTSDPPAHQRTTPANGFAEAVHAQIREARDVLRADAAAAGVEAALVDDAVSTAARSYIDARVHATDGEMGYLTDVIVDPVARRVTHVVVAESALAGREFLVPVERIAASDRETSRQAIMRLAPDVCVSTGSACSSAEVEPSYVLRALGVPDSEARATLRIGIGRFTSPADVDRAAAGLAAAWRQVAARAPEAVE